MQTDFPEMVSDDGEEGIFFRLCDEERKGFRSMKGCQVL
jgi:hypothetical protein